VTLILGCATQKHAVQVSDRRLVTPDGQLFDDDTNKAVLFCGRMALSYTGLAELDGKRTDLWLTEVLSSCQSLSDAVYAIRDRSTSIFQSIALPPQLKRHAFVGVGWSRRSAEEPYRPMLCSISNAQDDELNWIPVPREEFRVRVFLLQESHRLGFMSAGQSLDVRDTISLRRNLLRCAARGIGPRSLLKLLVSAIDKVAATNPTVGRNLLSISLPLEAVGSPDLFVVSAPPSESSLSFLYMPVGSGRVIQYGPSFVCQGVVMTNFQAGPL